MKITGELISPFRVRVKNNTLHAIENVMYLEQKGVGDADGINPVQNLAMCFGSCYTLSLDYELRSNGFEVKHIEFELDYTMESNPRRMVSAKIVMRVSSNCSPKKLAFHKTEALKKCPVCNTMGRAIKIESKVTLT